MNKNYYEVLDTWAMEFTLTVIVKQKNNGWIQKITVIYRPNQRDRRGALWDEIMEISCRNKLPWVIRGDFNVVRYVEERKGGDQNTQNIEVFNEIISMTGLIEIPLNDGSLYGPT